MRGIIVICSIIGAIFIVIGLYSVVWGKSKDDVNPLEKIGGVQELPVTNVVKPTNGHETDVSGVPMNGRDVTGAPMNGRDVVGAPITGVATST